jgi:hypothetical protein
MLTIIYSVAALLAAGPAAATQSGDGVVERLMAAMDGQFSGRASNTGIEGKGDLDDSESVDITLSLRSGVQYYVVGVCDNDCSDLDMSANGSSGNDLDSDYADDDVPILNFTPGGSGRVSLHIFMADCAVEPCRYGYRVYQAN